MLVLTRRKNESIIINDNIKIVVIGVYGDRVRLGIEAPPEIPVHRKEVFDVIKRRSAQKASRNSEESAGATPLAMESRASCVETATETGDQPQQTSPPEKEDHPAESRSAQGELEVSPPSSLPVECVTD